VNRSPLETLPEIIVNHARTRASEPAFLEPGRTLSWRDFASSAERIAGGLSALGVGPGDRVALLATNTIWAYEMLFGVLRAGAAVAPISPMLTPKAIGRILDSSRAKLLFADEVCRPLADQAVSQRAALCPLRIIGPSDRFTDAAPRVDWPSPDDPFNLIYSSGSTGEPKGIQHSHRTRVLMGLHVAAASGFTPRSRALVCIPPHSNGAFIFLLPAMLLGASVVLTPKFEPSAFLDVLARDRPTHVFIVPTMIGAIVEHPRRDEIKRGGLAVALSGGAPIPPALRARAEPVFEGHLAELWGLTEGLATYLSPAEAVGERGSVGRPLASVDLRIIDPAGREQPQGEGEIVGRSSFMMTAPEGVEERDPRAWIRLAGEWFIRTGDVGLIDADGYLHIRGRIKEMLISGGLNVYFVDLEAVLLEHPDVADAAVAAVPHAKWGEAPAAYVKLAEPGHADAPALLGWANERLAKHQRLVALHVLEAGADIPRNALGKVVRRELAGLACVDGPRPGHR